MQNETIRVRLESGGSADVVVLNRRPGAIEVVVGEGAHSMRCTLTPTRNGTAWVGTVMGREITWERSRDEVEAETAARDPRSRRSRPSR